MKLGKGSRIERPFKETDVETIHKSVETTLSYLKNKTEEIRSTFGPDKKKDVLDIINDHFEDRNIQLVKLSRINNEIGKFKNIMAMMRRKVKAVRDLFDNPEQHVYNYSSEFKDKLDSIGMPYTLLDADREPTTRNPRYIGVSRDVEDCVKNTYRKSGNEEAVAAIENLNEGSLDNVREKVEDMSNNMNWLSRINYLKLLLVMAAKFIIMKIAKFICDGLKIKVNIRLPIIGDALSEFLNKLICILKSTILVGLYFAVRNVERSPWSFVELEDGTKINVLNMVSTPISDITKFGRSTSIVDDFATVGHLVRSGGMTSGLRSAICGKCIDIEIEDSLNADLASKLNEILDPAFQDLSNVVSRCKNCVSSGNTNCNEGFDGADLDNTSYLNDYFSMAQGHQTDDTLDDTMNSSLDQVDDEINVVDNFLNELGASFEDIKTDLGGEELVPVGMEGVGPYGIASEILFKIEMFAYTMDHLLNAIVNANGVTLINNVKYLVEGGEFTDLTAEVAAKGLSMSVENLRNARNLEQQKLDTLNDTINQFQIRKEQLEKTLQAVSGPNKKALQNQWYNIDEKLTKLKIERTKVNKNIQELDTRIAEYEADYEAAEEKAQKYAEQMREMKENPSTELKHLQAGVFMILDFVCCVLNIAAINSYFQHLQSTSLEENEKPPLMYQFMEKLKEANENWIDQETKNRVEFNIKKWALAADAAISMAEYVERNLDPDIKRSAKVKTEGDILSLLVEPISRALAVVINTGIDYFSDQFFGYVDDKLAEGLTRVNDDVDKLQEKFTDQDGEEKTYEEAIREEVMAILQECTLYGFVIDGLKCLLKYLKAIINYVIAAFVSRFGDLVVNIEASLTTNIELVKFNAFSSIADKILAAWDKLLQLCNLYKNMDKYVPKLQVINNAMYPDSTTTVSGAAGGLGDYLDTTAISPDILPIYSDVGSYSYIKDYAAMIDINQEGQYLLNRSEYINYILGNDYNFSTPLLIDNDMLMFQFGIQNLTQDEDGSVITEFPESMDEIQLGNLTEVLKGLFRDIRNK